MKKLSVVLITSVLSANTWAVKLSDYKPFIFETLFTNPVCQTYSYGKDVISVSGKTLTAKPDDVYCKSSDEAASVARNNSPQYRLVEWISHKDTKELYAAYLSFSSKNIANALCSAVQRGVKLTMVLDGGESGKEINKDAENLKKCGASGLVSLTYRGSTGGLGFAHNKILIVNPTDKVVRMVFSSGNLTSGTSINHENWNFITTAGASYFIQSHKCAVEGMVEAGDTKAHYGAYLTSCRSQIKASPETDIQVFFSPLEGKAALDKVTEAGNKALNIEAISHRFSGALAKLYASLLTAKKPIKFILDDDIYWSSLLRKDIGRNTSIEAFRIYNDLISKGMDTRFMQTNQNIFQLQHNKFMIFNFGNSGAVFNGAGNFTTTAFTKNFENFYYITIPSVVEAYKKQYQKYWNEMASKSDDMPRDYILP